MEDLSFNELYAQSLGITAPWKVARVQIKGELKEVHVHVECPRGEVWVNPKTQQRAPIKDWVERTWRHLDTLEYTTIVYAKVPRVQLSKFKSEMVAVPWAEPGGRFTRRFESRLIDSLLQCQTVSGAATLARVTPDQMDGVMVRAVNRGMQRRRLEPIRAVGLDEKAYRKGHCYLTVLTDLAGNRVLEVMPERTTEATQIILNTLPPKCRRSIQAVALDMWQPYQEAVAAVLPEASLVFDRFHVSKHLNEAVDKVRRKEHRELSAAGDHTLTRSKYLWLKSRLDLRTQQGIDFRRLLNEDLDTGSAWSLKENFRHFWGYRSWTSAYRFLDNWISAARDSQLKPMQRVADLLDKHAEGLLNYIHHPITNAASESQNSRIQGLKTAARGLPKFESLRSRILFFLGKLSLHPA